MNPVKVTTIQINKQKDLLKNSKSFCFSVLRLILNFINNGEFFKLFKKLPRNIPNEF
jgi:hypothetical protein